MNKLLLITALLLSGCAHKHIDKEQYKYANPSARAECLKYDDGTLCTQYMPSGNER